MLAFAYFESVDHSLHLRIAHESLAGGSPLAVEVCPEEEAPKPEPASPLEPEIIHV
jgi:hypothetical protein